MDDLKIKRLFSLNRNVLVRCYSFAPKRQICAKILRVTYRQDIVKRSHLK
ncbi:hypothetical protein LEP1GSC108_0690 [Leptospira weilii str. UI 13098]|uniref:Uncharacterized protein n=1 Tax=Leptospira weilii str. UI 13098 TaxID=1088542 RepID=M6PXS6_9LEPT|nr:hypothetical protein LEP1GSC108_0690 [Leptospira weilii str. UI 13098]